MKIKTSLFEKTRFIQTNSYFGDTYCFFRKEFFEKQKSFDNSNYLIESNDQLNDERLEQLENSEQCPELYKEISTSDLFHDISFEKGKATKSIIVNINNNISLSLRFYNLLLDNFLLNSQDGFKFYFSDNQLISKKDNKLAFIIMQITNK